MMTFKKSGQFVLFFLMVFTEVTPWTIDLPQVRKYFFEKHERDMVNSKHEYEDYLNRDQVFYSNAQGNSLHNSKDDELYKKEEKYAEEFGNESHMEKKVQAIVHDGGAYLEGLRRSLEDFNRFLEGCNGRNISMSQDPVAANFMPPVPSTPSIPANSSGATLNHTNMLFLENNSTGSRMSCRQATEVSERVRRYAELAMWATRRLQDLAYAEKYQQTDKYEENELILKLAWFLDQLALLTGYEPRHQPYLPPPTTEAPTTSPSPITFVPQNDELKNAMIDCLKRDSSEPATVRCRYPLAMPDLLQQIVGGSSTPAPAQNSNSIPGSPNDSSPQQSMELLVATDYFRAPRRLAKRSPGPDEYYVPIPVHEKPEKPKPIVDFIVKKLSNLKDIVKTVKKHAVADFASQVAIHKHIHKRSVDDNSTVLSNQLSSTSKPSVKSDETTVKILSIHLPILDASIKNTKSLKKRSTDDTNEYFINKFLNGKQTVRSVKKRSTDDPLSKLANYFIKYKVWDGSNPENSKDNKKPLEFDVNNNLHGKIKAKRSIFYTKNRHLLPQIIKEKTNFKYKNLSKNLNKSIGNILEKKHVKIQKKLRKMSKRSLLYEHMYLPRIPMNPVGDISYYVKNKEGRVYTPSVSQAAQVRLGLEQVFQTGDIETVRRYGSNYNPAVPSPLYAGLIKGLLDS